MNTPPELIEMLITDPLGGTKTAEAEAGPSPKKARPSTPPRDEEDLTDRQFTPRFNSFLKQLPSTLHSVGKPGFFSYFFLGSACALKDSELWEALKLESLHFALASDEKRLTLVVKQNEPRKVKVFIIERVNSQNADLKTLSSAEIKEIARLARPAATPEDTPAHSDVETYRVTIDLRERTVKVRKDDTPVAQNIVRTESAQWLEKFREVKGINKDYSRVGFCQLNRDRSLQNFNL